MYKTGTLDFIVGNKGRILIYEYGDNVMATQKAIEANAQRDASTTIFGAGELATSIANVLTKLENSAGSVQAPPKPSLATGVVGSSGNVGTAKALSAGTFAYDTPANKWVMKRVTTTLSGVSKTQLLSGASDFDTGVPRNPAPLEGTKQYDVTGWVFPSGAARYGSNRGAAVTFPDGVGGTASDNAARPTRALPGEFTVLVNGKTPTNYDYKPRTG